MKDNQDKMYRIGMIASVLVLYAFSVYSYFGPEDVHQRTEPSIAAAVPATDQRMNKILETMRAHESSPIRQIRSSQQLIVPGSTCVITNSNLGINDEFHSIPADCFLVGSLQDKE